MYSVVLTAAVVVVVFCLGALAGNGYTTTAQHQRGVELARRRRELSEQGTALWRDERGRAAEAVADEPRRASGEALPQIHHEPGRG